MRFLVDLFLPASSPPKQDHYCLWFCLYFSFLSRSFLASIKSTQTRSLLFVVLSLFFASCDTLDSFPLASARLNIYVTEGDTANFDGSLSRDGGEIVSCEWQLYEMVLATGSALAVSNLLHREHLVKLTVVDDRNFEDPLGSAGYCFTCRPDVVHRSR